MQIIRLIDYFRFLTDHLFEMKRISKDVIIPLFMVLSLISIPVSVFGTEPIKVNSVDYNGIYIGDRIDYLNEAVLFQHIFEKSAVEPAVQKKMLSGELHTDSNIRFKWENLAEGYRVHLKGKNGVPFQASFEWGMSDILQEEVSSKFKPSSKKVFWLDYVPHSYWLRFQLLNDSKSTSNLILELDKHFYSYINVFIPSENGYQRKGGDLSKSLNEREQKYKNLAFNLPVEPGISTVYMRIDNWVADVVPFRIWSMENFNEHVVSETAFQGTIAGAFLFAFIFNLFIFILIRDASFLYLSLLTISELMVHLASSGFGFQFLWPMNGVVGIKIISLVFPLSFALFLLFCRSFLNIAHYSPRIDVTLRIMVGIFFMVAFSYTILPAAAAKVLLQAVLQVARFYYILVFIPVFMAVKKGDRAGIFLLIGLLLQVAANLEWMLSNYDIIPFSLINYLHIKGISFLIVMTLGLADKINQMKNSLVDLNITLERKVDERTIDLAKRSEELTSANERLQELDRTKSRFFANVSHELRTPLTMITAPIDSLMHGEYGKLPRSSLKIFDAMKKNANRLITLIGDLLDVAKIEAGKMILDVRNCNVSELVAFCISNIKSAANSKGITVKLTDETGGLVALVDRDLMEKAVLNLLSNAMKFNRPGGRITVVIERLDEQFVIRVKDNGIGIPQESLAGIFDRFSQVDSSSTRKQGGTGIGLSLTREIVDLHHGQITVTSELDKGSEFIINVPVGSLRAIQTSTADAGTGETGMDDRIRNSDNGLNQDQIYNRAFKTDTHYPLRPVDDVSETILIVEDHEDMQFYLESFLEKRYRTLLSTNGKNALEILKTEDVSLMLADIMMPEMDGYELVRQVRGQEKYADLPIILLTAKTEIADKIEGIEKGANDYLTKPFSPDELLARIRSQLKFKGLRDNLINARFKQTSQNREITDLSKLKIETVKDFLKENYLEESISRESLADAVEMSPDHLGRTFKKYVGEKIGDYLNRIRITEAARRLSETDENITVIGLDVGFGNLRTFNKMFLKYMHENPTEYRQKNRPDQ